MIKVVTPEDTYFPHKTDEYWFKDENAIKIFLAGTIDDGKSTDWQYSLISRLTVYKDDGCNDLEEDLSLGDLIIYSPRRENWDSNSNNEEIDKQIIWEQEHLDDADIIIMNILPDSKSPISLLELGLYGPQGKMFVFCTDKFYRFNNVKLTCNKYNIPLIESNEYENICTLIDGVYKEIIQIK